MKYNLSRKGSLFIISGPSGSGKSTLINSALKSDEWIKTSVSFTTREIKPGEIEGVTYNFVSKDQFNILIERGDLLEYAEVYDNLYGTSKVYICQLLEKGFDVLIDVDYNGALAIRDILKNQTVTIFLLPPSLEELRNRLNKRNRENQELIDYRISHYQKEVSYCNKYDYLIVNDTLNKAYRDLLTIIGANRMKISNIDLSQL